MLIQFGDKGEDVERIQSALKDLGYDLEVDGEFGNQTYQAVRQFQEDNGLEVDGEVGEKTLNALGLDPETLESASTLEDVSSEQNVDSTQEEEDQSSTDLSSNSGGETSASSQPTITDSAIDRIFQYLADSGLVEHRWNDRGKAPTGYLKGMALTYARVYCKYTAPENESLRDRFAANMAKGIAPGANVVTDAIARYADRLRELGADVFMDGVDVLRSLFTILIGLGMRESNGKYCTGWDLGKLNGWGNPAKAVKPSATNSEAGLFQISYDIGVGVPGDFHDLYENYKEKPGSGFLDIFSEGVPCSTHDAENFGEGAGYDFQKFSKECPAFTVELAALGLRTRANHWGPINKNTVEILQACYELLRDVETAINDLDGCIAVS